MKRILLMLAVITFAGMIYADTCDVGIFGQSNIVAYDVGHAPLAASAKSLKYVSGANYALSDDWQSTSTSSTLCSPVPAIANCFLDSTGDHGDTTIIRFSGYAVSGKGMHGTNGNAWAYRNPSNHFDVTTVYGALITQLNALKPEIILCYCGETDAQNSVTQVQWQADFDTVRNRIIEDLSYTPTFIIVQIGYWAANSGCVPIWKAQAALDNGSNVLLGACAYDLPLYTDGHVSYAGRNTLGTRLGTVIYKVYSGTLASGYRGPRIDSAHAITRGQFRVFVTYGAGTSCTVNGYRNFIVHQTDEQNVYPLSITGGSTIVVGIADRAMLYGLKFLYSDPHIYGYDTAQVVYDNNLLPLEPAP